jgi:hypothetical protein
MYSYDEDKGPKDDIENIECEDEDVKMDALGHRK